MPRLALVFVISAAVMHAGWNLIVKQVSEKQIFTWWALTLGSLAFLPLLIVSGPIPTAVWPYAVTSAFVEAAYFITLIRAYEIGDFSQVYPIARGAAPALIAVWAMLFLGERPSAAGIIGLLLLLAGLIVVGVGRRQTEQRAVKLNRQLLITALAVAFCISIYSAIDGAAVRIMSAAAYNVLVLALTSAFIAPVVLWRYGIRLTIAEGRAHWARIAAVGLLLLLAYMLVLEAYSMARVSYVGALREIQVVLAAIAGWRLLGESFGAVRTAGAALIFFGIVVVTVAG